MAPFGAMVQKPVQDEMKKAEAAMIAGTLHPFDAPVKDNAGKLRLASGTLSDDALNKMDYYVEGVQGKIPASK